MAADLAREVSDRIRTFGSQLENREPTQLLDDARSFARRRPGTFLLGALAAGVVAGRMFRATADGAAAASLAGSGGTGTGTDATYGPTYGAGTGVGTGPMDTSVAPAPRTGDYDGPTTTAPTLTTPSSLDPTTSDSHGQRTQDPL
jgi:hypothetical protein